MTRLIVKRYVILTALFSLICGTLTAQPPRRAPIVSPEIHPDRTVTFRMRAPNAKQIELNGQFLKANQPMTKGDDDLWQTTVGPIEPNLYHYAFVVDGINVADPNNPLLFPNERFKNSLINVPGDNPSLHECQNVPHGKVDYCFYHSKLLGPRPLLVYTPPGYASKTERLPVLYLVSGTTDTEETWFKVGCVNFILDNLIAQGNATPMIVAMPYGNMMSGTPAPSSPEAAEMYKRFSVELTQEIIPFVETHYRTHADRKYRAIAGFSRGGGQSLYAAMMHRDLFAWIGSYSAYLTPEVVQSHLSDFVKNPEKTNEEMKLVWLGVGKADFLFEPAQKFDAYLTEKGITHQSLGTEGGHTWMNARHYLAETLQLFFK